MSRRHVLWALLLVGLLLGLGGAWAAADDDFSKACISAAERISPSVVAIRVAKVEGVERFRLRVRPPERSPSRELPEELRRFFRQWEWPPTDEPEEEPRQPRQERRPFRRYEGPERPRLGMGSGVIYSDEGHIITNHHVIRDAKKIEVIFHDGDTAEAELVASDPKSDLAVIKVETDRELTPARFTDSDELRVGQWVLAVGSPWGLTQSVSAGIVSALGRNVGAIRERFAYENFIQTDADINQGSSGGPLVNLEGKVVGICIAIASENNLGFTPYPGAGFAIPANRAQEVVRQLIDRGKVVRGFLGVALQRLRRSEARRRGLESKEVVLVTEVLPNSPAEKAGVETDDLIVGYRGEKVSELDEFRSRVAATKPETETELVVLRGDQKLTLEVTIGEQPEPVTVAAEPVPSEWGLQLQTLTEDLGQHMGYGGLRGALVTDVQAESPAAEAELEPGDLILEVAKKPVASAEECVKALSEADDTVLLRVKKRSGEALYKTLER